ncbi:MAG: ABC transporter permease [Treponema sp.]|jgi:simple sugar transport system permease protein|nr:ABC transporter permease [Treponema sp.]
MNFPLLHSAVNIMTPILFAGMGGLFTELSGMLNIALEGLLLTGAFAAAAGAYYTGSLAGGIAAGILGSTVLSCLLGVVILKLRANVFVAGLAVNLLAGGLSVVLSFHLFGKRGVVNLPGLSPLPALRLTSIPVLADLVSDHSPYVYASLLVLVMGAVILYQTPFGFRLRSCDGHADALVSLGLNPDSYRFAAYLISGFCCGIGGSSLSLGLGAFVPNISAGKGWIALVVIFLGNRKPLGLLGAAFVFGLAEAFSNYAQGIFRISADFILAIPNIFTLLVMIGISVYTGRRER